MRAGTTNVEYYSVETSQPTPEKPDPGLITAEAMNRAENHTQQHDVLGICCLRNSCAYYYFA